MNFPSPLNFTLFPASASRSRPFWVVARAVRRSPTAEGVFKRLHPGVMAAAVGRRMLLPPALIQVNGSVSSPPPMSSAVRRPRCLGAPIPTSSRTSVNMGCSSRVANRDPSPVIGSTVSTPVRVSRRFFAAAPGRARRRFSTAYPGPPRVLPNLFQKVSACSASIDLRISSS